ncbi:serine hydrolase domain-containing protein [Pantoea agglomerans]|uniref:serine hydrolase domain-containing protein n=1 Tax=Enterobacter agglomerans TaxID=549 RepID=UPI003C7DCB1D
MHTLSTPAKVSSALEKVIDDAINHQQLTGAVVLVALHGEVIHCITAGMADRENDRPMSVDTLFRLASVSKPIVSSAAMVLVAQGKLGLDTNIRQWLPDFSPKLADGTAPVITVRQLLSHTAGLGYSFFERDEDGAYARAGVSDGMDNSAVSLAENLYRISQVPLLYSPGTAWGYSLATDVLGAVVASASGTTLSVAVRELVTDPLAMFDTGFVARDATRVAAAYVTDSPSPHRLQEGEIIPVFPETSGIVFSPARIFNPHAFPSAGAGMVGSAGDFLRLLEALRDGNEKLLPHAMVAEMERDQTAGMALPDMPGVGFGLGFSVLREPAQAASPESTGTWRWGGAYGHSWFVDRPRGLSVVAFTNTLYEGMSGKFVNDLRDAVYAQ